MNEVDLIVIGAGPGGYELAAMAARRGDRVVLIERDELGGTCLNRGCIPTKALLRSASVLATAREASVYGVDIEGITPCYSRAVERKNQIVAELRENVAAVVSGATVVKGTAVFLDKNIVDVAGETYTAPRIVIATGSEPARLPIPGSEHTITSDDLLAMTTLPESMVIIGGGVIGMEFACILHEFGVKVTVIEYCKEILPPFDKDIAKRLRTALNRRGIDILVGAGVTAIAEDGTVTYEQKGKTATVQAAVVMSAVGRRPVIPEGLDKLGIEMTRRGITVNDKMETSIPGIYAIGDVNGICMLAHAASAQAERLLGNDINLKVIPAAVFTHPECAMVGMTEEQCKEAGLNFKSSKAMFRGNGKALAEGEADGLVKLIVNMDNREVLGCHILGPHASDLIQEVATVMASNLTVDAILDTVHGHPTLSEVVLAAARAFA